MLAFPLPAAVPLGRLRHVPRAWTRGPVGASLHLNATYGEDVVFQVGVWAAHGDVSGLTYRPTLLPVGAVLRCITLEGVDHHGLAWRHPGFNVSEGSTRSLWFSLRAGHEPKKADGPGGGPAKPQKVVIELAPQSATPEQRVRVTVKLLLRPRSPADPSEYDLPGTRARLNWLNSRRGHDDDELLRRLPGMEQERRYIRYIRHMRYTMLHTPHT